MKRALIFFICACGAINATAQTPLPDFIKDKKIVWAAYASDSFRFTQNLSALLRRDFANGKIEAYTPSDKQHEPSTQKLPLSIVRQRIDPATNENQDYAGSTNADPLFSSVYFDNLANDLVQVEQIIYVEGAKVKSFVPWVTPLFSVITPNLNNLGLAELFSTAQAKSTAVPARVKRRSVYLGETVKSFNDSADLMVKQYFQQHFAEAIWPGLNHTNVTVYRLDSNIIVPFEKLNASAIGEHVVNVPVYDSSGEIVGNKAYAEPLSPRMFNSYTLSQRWYYDARAERVFNEVISAVLYATLFDNNGIPSDKPVPVLRLVFK